MRNFAHHSVPLHALTEKNAPFQWTFQCQEAFTYLLYHSSCIWMLHELLLVLCLSEAVAAESNCLC